MRMSANEKPAVQYECIPEPHIKVGESAYIVPANHPNHLEGHHVTNGDVTRTSRVISHDEKTGRFETLNTIYERTIDAKSGTNN